MEKIDDLIKLIDSREEENTQNLIFNYTRRWPWFLAFCIAGVLAGYFVFKNSPDKYEVTSRILVKSEPKELSSVLAFENSRKDVDKKALIANNIGILKSYTLYRKALENLNWNISWYRKKLMYEADLYLNEPFEVVLETGARNAKNLPLEVKKINDRECVVKSKGITYMNGFAEEVDFEQRVVFGQPFKNEYFSFTLKNGKGKVDDTFILVFNNIDKLTSQYLSKTVVYAEEENSDIIAIMIEGQDRQREADFINELNNVLIEYGMRNKYESSENSLKFIDSQLERIQNSLGTAEENFSNYRRNNKVMDLGQEAQAVFSNLQQIEQEQYLTQLQIDFYKDLQIYLDDSKKLEEMMNPTVIGITDANLSSLLSRLTELNSRKEVLSLSVQSNNPALEVINKEIKFTRDGLEETIKNLLKTTESKMQSLTDRYNTVQKRLTKLPETEKRLIGIQREFDLNNEIYTYMLQKKTEASISKASIIPEIQVIDEAIVAAARQTGPNFILNVAGGLLGGGIIPFIIITLLIVFNNKIETVKEVENSSKIPVFEGIMKHRYKVKLPVLHHPRSGIAESFRGLKSQINTLMKEQESKVISVNSLIPGEGKSFISSNLSVVFAKTNKKVLLIGADLHKPMLHEIFGFKESPGLSDFLNNEKNVQEIIQATSVPNLYVIQTGTCMENPSDLMDSLKFEKLIDETKDFDYVIFDNAPLLLVPDAIITSQFSDISLFILRINYSHKEQVRQINKTVDFNKIEKSAIVMNDVPESGYGYGNGYRKKYWKKGYGEYKKQA